MLMVLDVWVGVYASSEMELFPGGAQEVVVFETRMQYCDLPHDYPDDDDDDDDVINMLMLNAVCRQLGDGAVPGWRAGGGGVRDPDAVLRPAPGLPPPRVRRTDLRHGQGASCAMVIVNIIT
jgi:hypothetical protein